MRFLNTRTNRATYWMLLAALIVIYAVLNAISSKQVAVSEGVLIVLCIPRLHDIGRSGWWAGGVFLLEIGIALIGFTTLPLQEATIIMGAFVLLIAALLVWLGTIPGEPGPNRYGDPPRPGLGLRRKAASAPTDMRI
jgi:uncharacterized membrane protein YhaH (DUF805 family)